MQALHRFHCCGLIGVGFKVRSVGALITIAKCRPRLRFSVMAGNTVISLPNGDPNMCPDSPKTYQVVVAATRNMGIGKDGKLPWRLPSDLKYFKELTMTTSDSLKKNAVIMGRKTWESIPLQYRPLPGRLNVVLTRSGSLDIATSENVVMCGSMASALELLAATPYCQSIEKVFVIGGGQVLRENLNSPGCDAIHVTEIEADIDCDTFIPPIDSELYKPWCSSFPRIENNIRHSFVTYVRVKNSEVEAVASSKAVTLNNSSYSSKFQVESSFLSKMILERHEEYIYLRLIEDILSNGIEKDDRTGTGTLSKFGCQMRFNLRKSFPLLTTKKVFWRGVVEELLWFISGSTNAKVLQDKGVHIWDGNASRDYLDSIGLTDREEGDLGPVYGFQWRHFGASYSDMRADYTGQGFDQLLDVIDKVKNKPDDRRIVLSAWNPSDLKLMALPPCHMFAQFYVANGELSCQMYQQSADMGLGVPFNIASYSLLTCMIAHVCVARIRNALAYATHTFFQKHGFLYVQTPIITTSDCEGAGEMFQVTTMFSDAEKVERELKQNPLPSESDIEAAKLLVGEKGVAVKQLKSAKAGKEEITAAVAELNKAKEIVAKLDERSKLKPGLPQKDGKLDYSNDFFARAAFLTVSGQLQVETFACALSSVYTFGPTFRAEHSHTSRHLAEFWMVEPEIAFADLEDDMNCAEEYVRFLCQWLLDNCLDDMQFIVKNFDKTAIDRLKLVSSSPFVRISYTEAVELLEKVTEKKFENKVEWGIDLASEHERYLTEVIYKKPVIVYNYPKGIKAFYMRLNDDNKTVAAMDVLVPKVGELIGGSQREERYDVIERRILEAGLPLEPYDWYLDLRRYGTVKHCGFGLGFERMVLFATGIDNIRDVIPFPRFPGRADL